MDLAAQGLHFPGGSGRQIGSERLAQGVPVPSRAVLLAEVAGDGGNPGGVRSRRAAGTTGTWRMDV